MADLMGELNRTAGDMLAHAIGQQSEAERWESYLEPVTRKMAELDLSDTVPACASCGVLPAYVHGRCFSCFIDESNGRALERARFGDEASAVIRKLREEGKL